MLLHALLTGSLAALAAALGVAVEHTHESLPWQYRALLCGAVAAYCALGRGDRAARRQGRRWILGRGVPSVLVPIALLFVWPDLHVGLLVWILVAVVVWLVLEKPADGRPRRGAGSRPQT